MKLPLALGASILLAASLARADVVIVQQVNGAGQSGQVTVKVSGNMVRTDVSAGISTITDASTGNITTLVHARKAYMVISSASAKSMIDQMTKVLQHAGAGAPAQPLPTGRKDKINGYDAEEYTFNNGMLSATYWVSSTFPNADQVKDALTKMSKGTLASVTRAFAPDLTKLPGVPVRTEMEFGGQKLLTDLVSATVQPVDPSEFKPPADYTEMKLPAGGVPATP